MKFLFWITNPLVSAPATTAATLDATGPHGRPLGDNCLVDGVNLLVSQTPGSSGSRINRDRPARRPVQETESRVWEAHVCPQLASHLVSLGEFLGVDPTQFPGDIPVLAISLGRPAPRPGCGKSP